MKFEEALIKLRKIAKGKYCNLTYGITVRPSGEREVEIKVYVDQYHWTDNYPTFAQALTAMRRQITPEKYVEPDDHQITNREE